MIHNYVINHRTYLKGPTLKGKIACAEKSVERVQAEIILTTNRLTNPYNLMVGSEVLLTLYVQGNFNYVVLKLPVWSKQPILIKKIVRGSSKVSNRQKNMEFGISRNTKVWGRRRIHSTALICGKESSLKTLRKWEPLGSYQSEEINKLIYNSINNKECDNLSLIMSDPDFLIANWIKIQSHKTAVPPALIKDTLGGIELSWFHSTALQFRNGLFKFSSAKKTYIPKPNRKEEPLTMLASKDKIVQEAMKFLLELVFEQHFRKSNHGHRPGKDCQTALNQIQREFGSIIWFIEGNIEQQFPTVDHHILTELISKRIHDQAFIDLIWKYIRTEYGELKSAVKTTKIGIVENGILFPILSNIYMHPFDVWMEDTLIPCYTKGKSRKTNPKYHKLFQGNAVMVKHNLRKGLDNDRNFRELKYIRYVDNFLLGVIGNKEDCILIRQKIREFLLSELKMNINKTKITHGIHDSALFLGYRIHMTPLSKMPVGYNSSAKLKRKVPRPLLDAPIDRIVKRLIENGYAKKSGNPTSNGKFIHLNLHDLILHYRAVEGGILNYYGLSNNYSRVAARVHYILKYSCSLTIASKMRLNTMRKVYYKYGSNLNIKNELGEVIAYYPTVSYKRPKTPFLHLIRGCTHENLVDKLTYQIKRGRKGLKGPCSLCGATKKIETHSVQNLRKR
jgi:retron-type reverse transcriptase